MAIRNQKKRDDKIYSKETLIMQQAERTVMLLGTLVNDLEKFTAFMFLHAENYDPEDVATVTGLFEVRRAEIESYTNRLNAISAIAGAGVAPKDIPANVAAFIATIGYNDAAYSAEFDG